MSDLPDRSPLLTGEPTPTEAVPFAPADPDEHPALLEDEAGNIVEVVQSESGVIYIGHDQWCKRVTLSIPMELLKGLAEAWTGDDSDVLYAVRNLFDGQDGELQFLSSLGIRP